MRTTKYKSITGYSPRVEAVVIERESDSSVWIKGRRLAKVSSYESYFDTFQEAKAHLLAFATDEMKTAQARLDSRRAILLTVQEIELAA